MIATFIPENWRSARDFAQEFFGWGGAWGFRGHNDASWPLVTSFERIADLYQHPLEARSATETKMLKHFKRRAHFYLDDPPAPDDDLEWLAMIQHYGGPTRLLDFSRSFYVAAFFATERAKNDAAVWAIKIDEDERSRDLKHYYDEVKKGKIPKTRIVSRVEPERMNQRLSVQQGFFLFPHNISVPFVENLVGTLGISLKEFDALSKKPPVKNAQQAKDLKLRVLKMILKPAIHPSILSDLKAMNVTHESLYPGLVGFAQSVYFHLIPFKKL